MHQKVIVHEWRCKQCNCCANKNAPLLPNVARPACKPSLSILLLGYVVESECGVQWKQRDSICDIYIYICATYMTIFKMYFENFTSELEKQDLDYVNKVLANLGTSWPIATRLFFFARSIHKHSALSCLLNFINVVSFLECFAYKKELKVKPNWVHCTGSNVQCFCFRIRRWNRSMSSVRGQSFR